MNRTDNQSLWDAKRFIREYAKMGNLIKSYDNKSFDDISWANQIRIKRLAAVLRAFLEMKGVEEQPLRLIDSTIGGYWDNEELFKNSSLSDTDHARLMALVKDAMNDDNRYRSIMQVVEQRNACYDQEGMHGFLLRNRMQMFGILLKFRLRTEELLSHFDGIMAALPGGYLACHAVKGLYFSDLRENNDKVDEMLAILLGEKFKKSFSEEELQNDYGFPHETDGELIEWECDNM